MEFSPEQFDGVVREIEKGLDTLRDKIAAVPGIIADAVDHWWVTDPTAAAIRWLGDKIVEFCKWLWETAKDLLKGVAAPVYMGLRYQDWLDIRHSATQVAANIDPNALKSSNEWQGTAAGSYKSAATLHNSAAKRIGDIGKDASNAVLAVAVAGAAFYAGIAAVVAKAIAAVTAALAAAGTVLFSWAGALVVLEEMVTDPVSIAALVTALTTLVGAQATAMAAIGATATDNTTWQNGKWPDAATGDWDNGTRLDGVADWSVK